MADDGAQSEPTLGGGDTSIDTAMIAPSIDAFMEMRMGDPKVSRVPKNERARLAEIEKKWGLQYI